ncbi:MULTISPECIES: EboA domain-containing protein [Rhodomicrobium]|uniref:EboA domain-containing protein n=1 Tax=Rhodomicrobium TaxID=1068 RepID=UPI000B4AC7BA|nr:MULTISPECIES: EboA domain-containing protein [Rhodomicrobium]
MQIHAPELLSRWLEKQTSPESWRWLSERIARGAATPERDVFITLGLIPRRLGRADLALDAADLEAADAARPGWDPRGWSVDGAARVLVLLRTVAQGDKFPENFQRLCRTADVAEAIAFYRGLPLYPQGDRLEAQAAEGLRSNMSAIFEAVAHNNAYPRDHFDDHRWNHMILKALFVGSALAPIQGLDARANADLALMLFDYAHERWAAERGVSPELWRGVGSYATTPPMLADLARVLANGATVEREAAALALAASQSEDAAPILQSAPDLARRIETGALTWQTLA